MMDSVSMIERDNLADIKTKFEGYRRERQRWGETVGLSLENREGVSILHNWKNEKDRLETVFNELMQERKIGTVDVGEKYEMYIKAMFISIEELGLKVDYDEKEKKVVLKDKSKEKYMPKLKDYMGKEEVKLKSSWTNAAVIERNIAAEGEPEVKRKYLLLDTSMKTMLRMKSEDGDGNQIKMNNCFELTIEAVMGSTKSSDQKSLCLIPLAEGDVNELDFLETLEVDKEGKNIFENNRITRRENMGGDDINKLNDLIQKKQKEADEYVINTHGFAGKDWYSLLYENNNIVNRLNEKAILILPTVMGSDGTMFRIGSNSPELIDQTDQARQIDLLISSYGLRNKKLGVIGHSMGGGAVLYYTSLAEGKYTKYLNDFENWENIAFFEKGEVSYSSRKIELLRKQIGVIENDWKSLYQEKETLTKKYEELHLRQAEIETNREDFDWQVEIFKSQVGEIEKRLMEIDDKIKDFKERRGKVEADEDMAWQTVALVEEYLKRGPENRPDEWCIAEEPCMSGYDTWKLVSLMHIMGIAVNLGNNDLINRLLPEAVSVGGNFLAAVQRINGELNYGAKHHNIHVGSIAQSNDIMPTGKQANGIIKSDIFEGNADLVTKLNHYPRSVVVIANGDHLIDAKRQTEEMQKWGINLLTIYVVEADHFAMASPEHRVMVEPWMDLTEKLTEDQWVRFIKIVQKTLILDDYDGIESTRRLVPRGVNPTGVIRDEKRQKILMNSSFVADLLEAEFEMNREEGIVKDMVGCLTKTVGHIAFSSGEMTISKAEIDDFKKMRNDLMTKREELIALGKIKRDKEEAKIFT